MQFDHNTLAPYSIPVHSRRIGMGTAATTMVMLALIVSFSLQVPALMAGYLILAAIIVMLNARVFSLITARERLVLLLLVTVMTIVLPWSALHNDTVLLHYISEILSVGVAVVVTRNVETYYRGSRLSLAVAQGIIAVYLAFTGLEGFPLDDMIPGASSNGVTSYLIVLQANYSVIQFLHRRRSALVTPAITLAICIVGWGRGSILSAFSIIVLNLLLATSLSKHTRTWVMWLIALFLVAGSTIIFFDEISFFIEANTKLGAGLYDPAREQIINDYLGKMDVYGFFLGQDFSGTSIPLEFNNNPHNSFIRAHHLFGLPYLIVTLLLPVFLIRKIHSFFARAYFFMVVLVVLFRASTEPILFPTFLDLYFFSMAFCLGRRPAALK